MSFNGSVAMKGKCKGCGLEFSNLRPHLKASSKCSKAHESDQNPLDQDPQYILSGPCQSCGKVFKQIRKHLAQVPLCMVNYDMTTLQEASKESTRLNKLKYHQDNRSKLNQQSREYYQNNREVKQDKRKIYYAENKDRINKLKKMNSIN